MCAVGPRVCQPSPPLLRPIQNTTAFAKAWISYYKAQAVSYQSTGITLALLDLAAVQSAVVPRLGTAVDALRTALLQPGDVTASAAANSSIGLGLASNLLRRRAAMATMGSGEQSTSVDVGSMLTGG